jgi:predicted Zn-dependent peptidase
MAHFVEHMIFKGTEKRKAIQIINRLEDVGAELNAYTTKEETVFYAAFLNKYEERSIELISDLIFHSIFPPDEIEKEIEVIKDEIESYNDSPAELIFDDFEELIFHSNEMSHNVLGSKENLDKFTSEKAKNFYRQFYLPQNMVFFSCGNVNADKIVRLVEKYFDFPSNDMQANNRKLPDYQPAENKVIHKDTNQAHCILGCRSYDMYHSDRMALYLLNNILGGPGMNSLLNLRLREKTGLVYNVESTVQEFTDCGWWGIYFGSDPEDVEKCERLIRKELTKLSENRISESRLKKYKQQLIGQLALAAENKENMALSLGKSYLRFGKYDSSEKVKADIESVTAQQLQNIACELFNEKNIFVLKYSK